MKAALGKKAKTKKEKNIKSLQEYYLWNIEGNDLRRASEPIYLTGKSDNSVNSCELKIPENTTGVIKSKIAGNKIFYVWDTDKKLFVKKELSKEELKSYKKADTSDNAEKTTHSLNNDSDREIIRVTHKRTVQVRRNQKSGDNAGWHK